MPQDNSTSPAPADKSYTLYCPTCGRELLNYAQHPTLTDHTIAYCVCNSFGPVLDYPTESPPDQYMIPPAAGNKENEA